MWVLDFENKITFCVITLPNDVIMSKILHRCKALIKPFHTRYYSIWFALNKNLTYIRPWAHVKVIDLLKVTSMSEDGP